MNEQADVVSRPIAFTVGHWVFESSYNLLSSLVGPQANSVVLLVEDNTHASEEEFSQHPSTLQAAFVPFVVLLHPRFYHTADAVAGIVRHLAETEAATSRPMQCIESRGLARHDRKVPSSNLECDVDSVQTRNRKEALVRRRKLKRATNCSIERCHGRRRGEDERGLHIEDNRLVSDHLPSSAEETHSQHSTHLGSIDPDP